MLAADPIVIKVGRERHHLRPTLRAAMRLNRRFGGLDKLAAAIADENVSVMAAIIAEAEDDPSDLPEIIAGMVAAPLHEAVAALKEPLLRFVAQLFGFDPEAADDDKPDAADAAPVTFAEHYARLYRMATGWLGWPPETAWDATPAEITEAAKGRTELLKAIFGGSDKPAEQSAQAFNANLQAFLGHAAAKHGKAA